MSKKIWGLPVSTPLNPAKIDPVVPDDKLANAVSAYMVANPVTPSGIGARPDTWTPTAEDVGATPASHAEDENNPHKVTIAQIGAAPATHAADKGNPHAVTAAQVGLGNVNNTADADKPVSTAQATAIADAKKAGTDAQTAANNAQTTATNAHGAIDNHIADKNNPHTVTCEQIGAATKEYADTKTSMVLLWENASPTSAFAAQTVNVDFSGFTHYAIEYRTYATRPFSECSASISIDNSCRLAGHGSTFYSCRDFDPNTHEFTDARESLGDGQTVNNNGAVPLKIYGIKGVIE